MEENEEDVGSIGQYDDTLLERELEIQEAMREQLEATETFRAGLKKAWSFETLAIQAALLKEPPHDEERLRREAAVNALLSDTELEPSDILGVTPEGGVDYSAENMAVTASRMLERVLAFLKRLYETIGRALKVSYEYIFELENRARRMCNYAKRVDHKLQSTKPIMVGRDAVRISVSGSLPANGSSMLKAVDNLLVAAKAVRGYAKKISTIGDGLITGFNRFDFDNVEQSLNTLTTTLALTDTLELGRFCNKPAPEDFRFELRDTDQLLFSIPLLGNKSFFQITPGGDGDAIVRARMAQRRRFVFTNTFPSMPVPPEQQSFEAFYPAQAVMICEKIIEIAGIAKEITEISQRDLAKAEKNMGAAVKQFSSKFEKSEARNPPFQAAIGFAETYSTLSATPQSQFTSSVGSTLRALLSLTGASLSALR